jgi:hypothetical protein
MKLLGKARQRERARRSAKQFGPVVMSQNRRQAMLRDRGGDLAVIVVARKNVIRRAILALTQFWCIRGLVGAEESGLKEIELSTAIHLAFHELELCDLALCLAVGPSQSDCGADGGLVFDDPGGE